MLYSTGHRFRLSSFLRTGGGKMRGARFHLSSFLSCWCWLTNGENDRLSALHYMSPPSCSSLAVCSWRDSCRSLRISPAAFPIWPWFLCHKFDWYWRSSVSNGLAPLCRIREGKDQIRRGWNKESLPVFTFSLDVFRPDESISPYRGFDWWLMEYMTSKDDGICEERTAVAFMSVSPRKMFVLIWFRTGILTASCVQWGVREY